MKRKKLMAVLGSVSILLTSCAGRPAYAGEELTEAEFLLEMPAQEEETLAQESTQEMGEAADDTGESMEEAGEEPPEETSADTGTEEGGESETATLETESESAPPEETMPETEQMETQCPAEETKTDTEKFTEPVSETMREEMSERTTEKATEKTTEQETEKAAERISEIPPQETETLIEETPETEKLIEEETEDLSEEETEELLEEETEGLSEEETEEIPEWDYGSYSGGAGGYYWDESWFISPDFRFTQVEKQYAITSKVGGTFAYEEDDEKARKVGMIPYGGAVCVLKETDTWCYIESGALRGFVPKEALTEGEEANAVIDLIGEKALTQGELLCEKADNKAFTYTKTTSYPVTAKKVYAMSLKSAWIYEYPRSSSRYVGDVASGSLVYVLKDLGDGWYFIESGDVRGFAKKDVLLCGDSARQIVSDLGEENAPLAEELVDPEENRSIYYTLLSVKSPEDTIGTDICQSALDLVGKLPYVYGGTSLSSGADCSGFVQSVFAGYGITLPRTAQEQGNNGQAVLTLEEAKPGDVVYYAAGPHVGIYLGNGKVVQCSGNESNTRSNPGKGPMVSDALYMPITSIRRYLIIREEGGADGGYRTDDTPYTTEQLETIWAIVAQEDNGSYDGALAVISSAMNRTESGAWSYEGSNAYAQLTAAGQYCYSMDSYWIPRLHGNVPDYVKQAVDDCLRRGIRNHNYTSFRSTRGKTTGASAVQIGGNWYFGS